MTDPPPTILVPKNDPKQSLGKQSLCLWYMEDILHDDDSPLHKAACYGDNYQLLSLIDRDGKDSINALGIHRITPLQMAIRCNHAETVRILLSAGADPTLEDSLDPAYWQIHDAVNAASWLGNQQVLAALLDFGLPVPASALREAASLNHVQCMKTILDKLGQKENNFSDMTKREGLLAAVGPAAQCWHLEAVELILTHLATLQPDSTVTSKHSLGYALVCAAAEFDCDDRCRQQKQGREQLLIMKKLIAARADVNSEHPDTAFWAAAEHPWLRSENIRLLLDNGLRLDKISSKNHRYWTPLFGVVANYSDDADLVKAFLDAGAKATATDPDLNTPLHVAAHASSAQLLVDHGADMFARNSRGATPFHTACEDGRVHVARFLLSHGASIEDQDNEGYTPFQYATGVAADKWWRPTSIGNQGETVRLLLEHSADTRVTGPDGRTALHSMAHLDDVNIARMLIEHGANVRAVTSAGQTALHAVCDLASCWDSSKRIAIMDMLLDKGADIEARDEKEATPLHASWSCASYYPGGFGSEMFTFLVERGADRFAKDGEGRMPVDVVDMKEWMCDENEMVRKRPKPVVRWDSDSGRVGRGGGWWRGRGRG